MAKCGAGDIHCSGELPQKQFWVGGWVGVCLCNITTTGTLQVCSLHQKEKAELEDGCGPSKGAKSKRMGKGQLAIVMITKKGIRTLQ